MEQAVGFVSSWPRNIIDGTKKIVSVGSVPLKINGKTQKAAQCSVQRGVDLRRNLIANLGAFIPICLLLQQDSCETWTFFNQTKATRKL